MTNALAVIGQGMELTVEDVKTIRETIGKDCNESQFKLFLAICQTSGANPILGEIHPSTFGGKLTVQFGVDFIVRKAKETPGYMGYDVQLVYDNDNFKMHQARDDDGRYYIVIDEHSFGFPRGNVIGGYAFAYREGMKPFSVIMGVEEVEHYKRSNIGMQKTMWTNNFADMFKKHMVRRALKAAFGLTFEPEDMSNNAQGNTIDTVPDRSGAIDVMPQAQETPAEPQKRKTATTTPPEYAPTAEEEYERHKARLNNNFKKLGITNKDAKADYIKMNIPNFDGSRAPTLQELIGVNEILESEIELATMPDELE